MDMLLGGLAFAAIILAQFAAVIVVHRERKSGESIFRRENSFRLCEPLHSAASEPVPSIDSPEQPENGMSSQKPLAPAFRAFAIKGTVMRAHHMIAVVAVILVGIGVKLIFLTAPTAEADPLVIPNVDASQLHQNVKNLPMQEFHDMSVVFSDRD